MSHVKLDCSNQPRSAGLVTHILFNGWTDGQTVINKIQNVLAPVPPPAAAGRIVADHTLSSNNSPPGLPVLVRSPKERAHRYNGNTIFATPGKNRAKNE